jgi:hypothetical protein
MARVGPAADDLMALARCRTGSVPAWAPVVEGIRERRDPVTRGQLAVTGEDLAGAGIEPGPAMGKLLERLLDLVIEDPALNTRDSLLRQAREWS